MDRILEIRGMSKFFGGVKAVSGFNLEVRRGEIVGIIGPNGAGKTTLFNLISGFMRPTSGEIWFNNQRITGLRPFQIANRGISRTFQLVDLFKEMTVLENCMVPCYSKRGKSRIPKGKKPWETALGYLEEMGLADRAKELAKNLPFGELRLLDIARAMVTEPDVLLLDEPFSGLDEDNALVLSAAIRRMHQRGQTMVVIEHRLRDLLKLVERVVAIVFGEKIAEGSASEIMNDPRVINAYLGERRT
jgi:branched-chain amino acid transport system ATP-binding protein